MESIRSFYVGIDVGGAGLREKLTRPLFQNNINTYYMMYSIYILYIIYVYCTHVDTSLVQMGNSIRIKQYRAEILQ